MQYEMQAHDLAMILALVRTGNLAGAGERLHVDASTVFRALQRIEKGLGQRLFERTRSGYWPNELAHALAKHAENIEIQLEAARSAAQINDGQVAGTVRITSTDTIMHGLIAPVLQQLHQTHPQLVFELHTGNELVSLNHRDADIAVRATRQPPPHLVGKQLGVIRVAVFAAAQTGPSSFEEAIAIKAPWIAPDDELPEHPSVLWRKKYFPKWLPTYRVGSILTVAELIHQGAGIGILPIFLAKNYLGLRQLSDVLEECQTDLWLLTHTDTRHLRRVSTVYSCLAQQVLLV